jgi:multidrug resistance efflux pump
MKSKFELYSGKNEHIKELISKQPSWIIRTGNTVLLLIICSLILLSYYFKYPEIITAKIIITTPIPPVRIKCKVDGMVERIFLNDQDTVKIDQPIALIKNDQGTNYLEILELKRQLSSVHFEKGIATKSLTIYNTEFKNLGPVQGFLSDFINSVIAYNSFINDAPLEKAIRKNKQLIKQYENLVNQNKSKSQFSKKQLDVSRIDFERQKKLFDQGVISTR